jgi:hypothetical protein
MNAYEFGLSNRFTKVGNTQLHNVAAAVFSVELQLLDVFSSELY